MAGAVQRRGDVYFRRIPDRPGADDPGQAGQSDAVPQADPQRRIDRQRPRSAGISAGDRHGPGVSRG